jgi:hypothetical protein
MSEDFVNTPMEGTGFVKTPAGYKGGPGVYDNANCPPANEYPRTPSPNGVPEKFFEETLGNVKPTGEDDQF